MLTYNLTKERLLQIARLCYQEQGTIAGIKAEASLAANILETSSKYKNKFGNDIYSFMRESGWFSRASYFMDNGTATQEMVDAVKDVLVNCNRTLPQFVNEHDCFSDILYVSNDGVNFDKRDRTQYKRDVTKIVNRWYSVYYFWEFPAPNSDPFGYTSKEARYADNKEDETVVYLKVGD